MPQFQTTAVEKWTLRTILEWTTGRFKQADMDTPLLDAQLLLCRVLNMTKIKLYMEMDQPLSAAERTQLRELVKRRLNGEPVAYILNEKHWYNSTFYVDKRVLIPRPETECLVDFVKDACKVYEKSPKLIFDFCTGSGCLAVTLAKMFPDATVVGIDIAAEALEVATENALRNNVENIEWRRGDLSSKDFFAQLKNEFGEADIIVANPPYVTEDEWLHLDISVKNYEPKLALTAPEEGLFVGKQIVKFVVEFNLLKKEFSAFAMEMAKGQPQSLFANKLDNYSFNTPLHSQKLNAWKIMGDMDNKERFLCMCCSS